jgi:CTP:phosphocholine cytidylyltransferase-like protein
MLEYAKVVLLGVCFWEALFSKELKKIIGWAKPHEKLELKKYIYEKYYKMYPKIIDDLFADEQKVPIKMQFAMNNPVVNSKKNLPSINHVRQATSSIRKVDKKSLALPAKYK